MVSSHAPFGSRCLVFVATVVVVIALITNSRATPRAQQDTMSSRRTSPISRDMRYREWLLKDLEKSGGKRNEKQQRLAWAQIRDDFRQMQVANNEMARKLSAAAGTPDYEVIAEFVAEIRKHAARLKSNLSLPEPDQMPPRVNDGLQMRTMLSALDGLIIRFVKNPIFTETEVINAGHAAKARRDLERIIEFSDRIRKSGEELKKDSGKRP